MRLKLGWFYSPLVESTYCKKKRELELEINPESVWYEVQITIN